MYSNDCIGVSNSYIFSYHLIFKRHRKKSHRMQARIMLLPAAAFFSFSNQMPRRSTHVLH